MYIISLVTMGELHLIIGPMFAGKTTLLINKANSIIENIKPDEMMVINHSSDSRYCENTFVSSHDKVKIPCIAMTHLNTLFNDTESGNNINNISNINYIFINEGQFFPDLYDSIKKLLFDHNKIIYICGLDGDYKQEPFPNCKLLELIPYASSVVKLTANCYSCEKKAPFTKRIINSTDVVLVGGSESYQPVCINHL